MRITTLCLLALSCAFGVARAEPFRCGRVGGDLTLGLAANIAGLDQHTTRAISTRDETMKPPPLLAQSVVVGPDNLTCTFRLRPGVRFNNGKTMTSADVMASFARHQRVGLDRSVLERSDAEMLRGLRARHPL